MTLDGFSQGLITALQQNATNFTYTLSNTALAGYPAQKIAFTLVSGGITRQGIIELTLVNDTGYALTTRRHKTFTPLTSGLHRT